MKIGVYFSGVIIALLMLPSLVYSQSFSIIGTPEYTLKGKSTDTLISVVNVKNISNGTVNGKVKAVVQLVNGHIYQICDFESCYPYRSTNFESMFPSAVAKDQQKPITIDLVPQGNKGISIITVTGYNASNPADFVEYTLTFLIDTVLSVDADLAAQSIRMMSSPVPNPANESIKLSFAQPIIYSDAVLEIYDIRGVLINSISVPNYATSVEFGTVSLLPGIYNCRLNMNGLKGVNRAFVVSH